MHRVFILSPAKTNGKRASLLMSERAEFDLARRLRSREGAPLGEVFAFLSGLYFRGKLAYSTHFGRPPNAVLPHYIIASDAGLLSPETPVSQSRLQTFGYTPIDPAERMYADPLRASAKALKQAIPAECDVVLLGSIATNKYAEILLENFREQLKFPREFIGRGDMSRGGLMLRAVRSGQELEYVALSEVDSRRGRRPPKLPSLKNIEH